MAQPECLWMINELLYNLEGDPVSPDSSYYVHLVDYCLLSIKTNKFSRDFLFQDMLFMPINADKSTKIDYILTSDNNSSITLPFKVEEGYVMSAKPLTFNSTDSPLLKAQFDSLKSNKTIFVGDNSKEIFFKPSDIAALKTNLSSRSIDFLCNLPSSERARAYFLDQDIGKDSIDFYLLMVMM
ncbi:MAG: hypothetical protein ACP5N1_07215 [Candidatus Woesearchaeota archaeon]